MSETRKLHPLHAPAAIWRHIEATGTYFPAHRCTGRTTAHCLRVLSAAIQNPDVWVVFQDHHKTTATTRYMLEQVQRMGEALGFQHMHHAYLGSEGAVCFSKSPPDRNLHRNRVVQE